MKIKKFLIMLMMALIVVCSINAIDIQAATKVKTDYKEVKQELTIFKGQTVSIWCAADSKVINDGTLKWKIISGKKNIKIIKNGQYIKGLKKGKAVIETIYNNKYKFILTINVTKAPKTKTKTINFDEDNTLIIPKNYYINNDTYPMIDPNDLRLSYTKNLSTIEFYSLKNSEFTYSDLEKADDKLTSLLSEGFSEILRLRHYTDIKTEMIQDDDYFVYCKISTNCKDYSLYFTHEAVQIGTHSYFVVFLAESKEVLKKNFDDIIKTNNAIADLQCMYMIMNY